jgi:hypothetical protein
MPPGYFFDRGPVPVQVSYGVRTVRIHEELWAV